MKLLLIRHGQSNGNASGDYSIESHDALSGLGQRQAQALAAYLQTRHFDRIITSPLPRALETLAPYLEITGQQAEIWPEVAEGCWQDERQEASRTWRVRPSSVPLALGALFTHRDEAVRPIEDESFAEGLGRVHATAKWIQAATGEPDLSLLMLTHGHFIRELLNRLLVPRELVRFPHDNCGMTSLAFDGGWRLGFCNRVIPDHA